MNQNVRKTHLFRCELMIHFRTLKRKYQQSLDRSSTYSRNRGSGLHNHSSYIPGVILKCLNNKALHNGCPVDA